jgi:hypothetical protein
VAARDRTVFVNCPFDAGYKPLFDAITYCVRSCRFEVANALEVSDAGEARLTKITRLIAQSRFSIHDISRIELDADSGLPRFNMPIELGIAIGARYLGRAEVSNHLLLVLDAERFRYQRFASDLAGADIREHHGKVAGVIAAVRDFLAPHVDEALPGADAIGSALAAFERELPAFAAAASQRLDEVTYTDRMRHLASFLGERL